MSINTKPPISTDNARDIAEYIDGLIQARILQYVHRENPKKVLEIEEQAELIKRGITDYLLVTDPRIGVYKIEELE